MYAVYAWNLITEGWEGRNAALVRLAGRAANENCASDGVYELVWFCGRVPEAEDLRDLLRAVPGVTSAVDWYRGLR